MTTDLQILRGNNQPQPSAIAYASPGMGLRGTAKAAQKFACLFLREYDAVRNRGTFFVTKMQSGLIRTDSAVITNFTAAVLRILRQLGDQSALPATEHISRADLLSHSIFGDKVTLVVRVTTLDGTVDFQIPIKRLA